MQIPQTAILFDLLHLRAISHIDDASFELGDNQRVVVGDGENALVDKSAICLPPCNHMQPWFVFQGDTESYQQSPRSLFCPLIISKDSKVKHLASVPGTVTLSTGFLTQMACASVAQVWLAKS